MDDRLTPSELMAACTCCGRRHARVSVHLPAARFPLERLRRVGGPVAVCPRCDLQGTAQPGWTDDFADDLDG